MTSMNIIIVTIFVAGVVGFFAYYFSLQFGKQKTFTQKVKEEK